MLAFLLLFININYIFTCNQFYFLFGSDMRLRDDVLFHEVNGEMVFLDVPTGNYFSLNEIGTRIWKGISEGESPDEIVRRLLAEYDVDETQIRSDYDDMLVTMKEEGLIAENEPEQ